MVEFKKGKLYKRIENINGKSYFLHNYHFDFFLDDSSLWEKISINDFFLCLATGDDIEKYLIPEDRNRMVSKDMTVVLFKNKIYWILSSNAFQYEEVV